MNSNYNHSKFDDIFGGNIDRESLDQPIGTDNVSYDDLPKFEDAPADKTVIVNDYDTELGLITETIKVSGTSKIQVGDFVTVAPHETRGDLRQGAVQPAMHTIRHDGYNRVKVTGLNYHGVGMPLEIEVEVYPGQFDYVSMEHCKRL